MSLRALTRAVPDSYPRATVQEPGRWGAIDLARAREQHAGVVAALRRLGVAVEVLAPAHELPDSVFVEDQAVIFKGRALLTRSGHAGRRAEREAVGRALAAHLEVVAMEAPACLDGGDVLVAGDTIHVGLSGRTDRAGLEATRAAFGPLGAQVVGVPVGGLHLKCVCSVPRPGVLLFAEGALDTSLFAGLDLVPVPAAEAYAANTLAIEGRVLLPAGYPRTAEILARLGLQPVPLEMSELRAGDGSVTCLSVLYEG